MRGTRTGTDEHENGRKPGAAGPSETESDLADLLTDAARGLQENLPEDLLPRVVRAAVRLIPGTEDASITIVVDRRQVGCRAPSSTLPAVVDAIQEQTAQGPCLDAVYQNRMVHVPNLAHETRWPVFAARALECGVGSMLCFQLYVEGDSLGALNLYARSAGAFDEESEHIGTLFASHAAIALSQSQKVTQLTEALNSRDLIGQAKGILMERYKITGQQAFLLLTRVSQQKNRKLRDIAEDLVTSGEMQAQPR